MLFRRKNHYKENSEELFMQIFGLIKDLDKPEFNNLLSAMEMAYQGYSKVRKVKTRDEKELSDIIECEKILIKES